MTQPPWYPPPQRPSETPSPAQLVVAGFWLAVGFIIASVIIPALVIGVALVVFGLMGRNPYI